MVNLNKTKRCSKGTLLEIGYFSFQTSETCRKRMNSVRRKRTRLDKGNKNIQGLLISFPIPGPPGAGKQENLLVRRKNEKGSLVGHHKNYSKSNVHLAEYIIEVGQCLWCLNMRPLFTTALDSSS